MKVSSRICSIASAALILLGAAGAWAQSQEQDQEQILELDQTNAMDIMQYFAPEGDSMENPGEHWNRFHDSANARVEIDACLIEADNEGADARSCVGFVAEACLSYAVNETTQGMTACTNGELGAWDAILNEQYQAAITMLNESGVGKLRDAQHAWIAFRDASCGVWYDVFEGGTMAQPIAAHCLLSQTANRGIELRNLKAAVAPL